MRNNMIPFTNDFSKRDDRDRAKCPSGWMAFDHHQRQKLQVSQSGDTSEPYPMLSGSDAPKTLIDRNRSLLKKPFSSVIVPKDLPVDYQNKPFHNWADESLIDDILAGVDNNVDEAISLIEAMFNSGDEDIDIAKAESCGINDSDTFDTQGTSAIDKKDTSFITSIPSEYEGSSVLHLDSSKSIPVEPEWEEDDVYLVHRKDGIKAMRSASRHSKAANNAYIKGDHISARRFSRMAEQEWIMAKKLNSKAAKEILAIRNCKNDLWTLDLHGLHAVEAVDALHSRLQTVETPVPSNYLTTLDAAPKESGLHVGSIQPINHIQKEKLSKHSLSTRPRQILLQVITGKGNHSRGAEALPPAIRNFLYENGYNFDETRPGTFMVRPKFRKHCKKLKVRKNGESGLEGEKEHPVKAYGWAAHDTCRVFTPFKFSRSDAGQQEKVTCNSDFSNEAFAIQISILPEMSWGSLTIPSSQVFQFGTQQYHVKSCTKHNTCKANNIAITKTAADCRRNIGCIRNAFIGTIAESFEARQEDGIGGGSMERLLKSDVKYRFVIDVANSLKPKL